MPDARLLAGAITVLGASAAGLGVPAATPRPPEVTQTPTFDAPPHTLPEALRRWLDTAHHGLIQRAETACFVASGRLRVGRSPWLPVAYRTVHELGHSFAADITATWYGRPVLRAQDGFVDRRGVAAVRGEVTVGPGLDQSAVSFLWSEAILIPASWTLPGVTFKQIEADHVLVQVRSDADVAGPLSAHLRFDAETGLPRSFSVPWRARGSEGVDGAPWSVEYLDWSPAERGLAPTQSIVQWGDERRPWLRLRLQPPVLNVPVTDQLHQIRTLLESGEQG
ncbi:MAG: hypothetical protein KDC39_12360 [Actinobacteria bacterium]|nr:hypothetical protein [Actinomycetota bacterium]